MFVSCECLCCQVEISATGRSLAQRSPTECGVCLSVIKWKINNHDTCCKQVGRRSKDYEMKRNETGWGFWFHVVTHYNFCRLK
jgi:hypothetical protein